MNRHCCALLLCSTLTCHADDRAAGEVDGESPTIGGSIEYEYERSRVSGIDGVHLTTRDETVGTVQVEVDARTDRDTGVVAVVELETGDDGRSGFDEIYLFTEGDAITWSAGRQYLPFGRFDSLFGADSLTEFGEIRATSLVLSVEPTERLAIDLFLADSNVDTGSGDIDHGVAIELASPTHDWRVGLGYFSDVAEVGDALFDEPVRRTGRRVGAVNAFAGAAFGNTEIFFESVFADGRLAGIDATNARPSADTLEILYRFSPAVAASVRRETSRQIDEAARRRYGASLEWRLRPGVTIGIDYLDGRFRDGDLVDDEDRPIRHRRTWLAHLVLDF